MWCVLDEGVGDRASRESALMPDRYTKVRRTRSTRPLPQAVRRPTRDVSPLADVVRHRPDPAVNDPEVFAVEWALPLQGEERR